MSLEMVTNYQNRSVKLYYIDFYTSDKATAKKMLELSTD